MYNALSDFGAPLAAHGIRVADFAAPGNVYQLGLPPRRIDVLTAITGVSFEQAWEDRTMLMVTGHDVPVAGRQTLLVNKRATGRPKDMIDVLALERAEVQTRKP